jgi:hypothetical protein
VNVTDRVDRLAPRDGGRPSRRPPAVPQS